jgi:prepilin-type N-terminal cleavage/methylation domain-containing protein
MRKHTTRQKKGFTLVEMIVSIGLFTIVLFIASSAFLAVLNADRKSRATRTAIDNLNLSLEDMSRRIKTGTTYNCGGGLGTADCTEPDLKEAFAVYDQNNERVIYKRGVGPNAVTTGAGAGGCGNAGFTGTQGCLIRDKGGVALAVTGKDIDIQVLRFMVNGTASFSVDTTQPYVVILVGGVTTAGKITSKFNLQTMVTQRMYDL